MTNDNRSSQRNSRSSTRSTETATEEPFTPNSSIDLPQITLTNQKDAWFYTTVLTIRHSGGHFSIHPADLVHQVHRNDINVDNMVFDTFTSLIEEEIGHSITKNTLMVDVPDPCGNPGEMLGVDSGRAWRAALQRCRNAGFMGVQFYVFDGEHDGKEENMRALHLHYVMGIVRIVGLLITLFLDCAKLLSVQGTA
ncbi:Nn.00g064560.m01.CDS01 [Neocucurbitaria sp. VM-36]